ncbi:MAG TPA: TonB-dependent receptor [Bryobacteraceae bacterium]|nr:TonB-dependent receptor [Bryobacteraceae bacterium]
MLRRDICVPALLLLAAATGWTQDSRGSITGRVVDPQGSVVPNAQVVITNTETNIVNRTATNETGYYEVNLLNPGTYSVATEAPGFKKTFRSSVQLQVGGRLDIELQLQVGQLAETVEVTAEAPLLDTTSASGGRVIDRKQIVELPFSDMNPFALAGIAPGMQWTGQPEYRRPFDNGGTSAFNTSGAAGANEYSIDGMPVAGTDNRVGFTPSSEAVQEFKLETTSFDAATGHTAGAVINVMTNSGTNKLHGSLFDQHWQQRWNATPHVTRNSWEQSVASGKISKDTPKQASGRSNDFGGDIGGPIYIPKIFNGKDKAFFYFQYNGIYQKKAETTGSINITVPKAAWKSGDFSDLLAIDPTKHQVYDPRSAVKRADGRVVRMPFADNKGIPILNPVYKAYAAFYPEPNNPPGIVSPEGRNNYYAAQMPKDERFNSIVNRYDFNVSEKQRLYGRWYWNHRLADEYDWTYETMRGLHANGLTRINKGGGGDWIYTFNANNVLDIGASWTRFAEGNQNDVLTSFKPSDVGFPAYMDEKAGSWTSLPRIQFTGDTPDTIQDVAGGYPVVGTRGTTAELRAQMTTVMGAHSLKYGWQERRYYRSTAGPGDSSGRFSFNDAYVKQMDNTNTQDRLALSWASFMMALPSDAIAIATNDSGYWGNRYRAFYLQDDWRLTSKLRLSLGLRYERDGGVNERFNRTLSGGFDWFYRPVFAELVEKVYQANPLVPGVSNINIRGGVPYLGADGHTTTTNPTHHWMPRAGVVYQLTPKMVVRAGYGWYYDSRNVLNWTNNGPSNPGNQDGYSQGTSTTLTNDTGLSFCCDSGAAAGLSATNNPLVNPFPVRANGTRFDTPYGNSLGSMIRQGRGWDIMPRDYNPAWQQRWRIGIQRELSGNMVVEAAYNGAYSIIPVMDKKINYLPEQYWWKGNTRNDAVANDLQTQLPNPFNIKNLASLKDTQPLFYNWMSTQGFFTGSNIQKQALLRKYPNMGSGDFRQDGGDGSTGGNLYHDLQLQFERRFSKGFQTSLMYTYSYGREQDWWMNEYDADPTWRPQNDIRPHRFVWTSIYQLPFGKGRKWVTSSPLQHIVGGWQLSWVYQIQNGSPVEWGNRFFYGDPETDLPKILNSSESRSKDLKQWFDPSIVWRGELLPNGKYDTTKDPPSGFVGFEGRSNKQPASYTARIFQFHRSSWFRSDGIRNWDVKVKRNFQITERLKTSFDVDLLNATNHTNFAGPNTDPTSTNFGRVTEQRGLSRIIQLNLRVDF